MPESPEVTDIIGEWERALRRVGTVVRDGVAQVPTDRLPNDLFYKLIDDPTSSVSDIRTAIDRIYPGWGKARVEILGFPKATPIAGLTQKHLNKMVGVSGIVRAASEVKPRLTKGVFECERCGRRAEREQPKKNVKREILPPLRCPSCNSRQMLLLEEKSEYQDTQYITLGDPPEEIEGTDQPAMIIGEAWDSLCGRVSPGERVKVIGILRVKGAKTTRFDSFIEVNSIVSVSEDRVVISEEDEERIAAMASRDNFEEAITDAIAPGIYGLTPIKRAIAYQLFGGVTKAHDGDYRRGDIHILLVGDPGLAKSALIRAAYPLAPRGVFTSGKGSSAAGLTFTVNRDETTGRYILEAGALVLANGGLCVVDELDKMNPNDRSALHEAMEQQTISVAKAGLHATLQAKAALLAAANPKMGRFDLTEPLAAQINLSAPLLSRFDLIFVMSDNPSADIDSETASHILGVHSGTLKEHKGDEHSTLKKWIHLGKRLNPSLTKAAGKVIKEYYIGVRKKPTTHSPVSITPRQMESVIRIAEARARMRLSDTVTADDARAAVSILDSCLRRVAYDRTSDQIDIDMIMSSSSQSQREQVKSVKAIIEEVADAQGNKTVQMGDLMEACKARGYSIPDVERAVDRLTDSGEVYRPRLGQVRVVKGEYQ